MANGASVPEVFGLRNLPSFGQTVPLKLTCALAMARGASLTCAHEPWPIAGARFKALVFNPDVPKSRENHRRNIEAFV